MSDAIEDLGLSPETTEILKRVRDNEPSQQTPEFVRLRETMFGIQVCTSLSDEEATVRANLVPAGTSLGWVLSVDPALAPLPCADQPDTHRHLIFEC